MASAETGWTNKFTGAIGYYWLRERGEDAADASIMEYQGSERAYITGADDNFYKEWTSRRFEFLGPISPSDAEQLMELRRVGQWALDAQVEYNGPCDHEARYADDCLQCQLRASLNPLQKETQ